MRKLASIVLLVLAIAGCAVQPQGRWQYQGLTAVQAQSLAYDCSVTARAMHPGSRLSQEMYAEREYRACMQARGFIWTLN